jgi:DNA-directed RNA polymerase specialized sigma24 family protein
MPQGDGTRTFTAMELAEALDALPEAHAVALRLEAAGVDPAVIAAGLGIDEVSVHPLLEVAREKLTRLLATDELDKPR